MVSSYLLHVKMKILNNVCQIHSTRLGAISKADSEV